jgi:hypothetical protein
MKPNLQGLTRRKKETLLQESRKVHRKKKAKPSNIYKDCPYEERKPFSWNPQGLAKRIKETVLQKLQTLLQEFLRVDQKEKGNLLQDSIQELTKKKKKILLQETTRVDQKEKGDPAPGIAQG